ncbi:HAD family hydrolase [Leadbettera azotonutricia]|uniref:Putative HAD-superfamily hydrolase, subfamily IA, variant 1 n=1 Tax=Leadbettera azotonutricia (strain ATCC BAA-888 / DSM 13862 / ZAS-9) TaxID=545695 RepID=F5Y916_LEAAZ|nr:HAD family hydrolase [Leadbettera azotonutricia]AEF81433.1 putative HAD-superfamily hydrolase, subfamily IA, variant 1 [Leadbettera azotonutricia ZAS-9]
MEIYNLPKETKALIFDMDLTLYTCPAYGKNQIDNLIAILGKQQGKNFGEMNKEIEARRKSWAASHGGKKPSLSNLFLEFGVTMDENVKWREEACEPEKYLSPDAKLKETLKTLSTLFLLGVVTNNPVSVAERTLRSLGVEDCFAALVGLDTCMIPKPHKLPFAKMSELLSIDPKACVSIGDRYDIDIGLPLEMGMGGILVDGVEDVYELPGILKGGKL